MQWLQMPLTQAVLLLQLILQSPLLSQLAALLGQLVLQAETCRLLAEQHNATSAAVARCF